jgi:hypothetical protein
MLADLTAAEIRDACDELYRPDGFRYAPAQVFIEQFAEADPPTTYLRVSFPRRFTDRSAKGLARLGSLLQDRHGADGNLVFCIYLRRMNLHDMTRYSIELHER